MSEKPIAYITGWYGGYPTIQVIDGTVLPNGTPLYAAPPKRKPLSSNEIKTCHQKGMIDSYYEDVDWGITPTKKLDITKFARAVEAAHGITS